jgi:hypothetical protein
MVFRPLRGRARQLLLLALSSAAAVLLLCSPAFADTILGTPTPGTALDDDAAGTAEAFRVSASASGTVDHLSFYVDSTNRATRLSLGVYAASGAHPGALLTSGSSSAVAPGWNTIAVTETPLTSGTAYWVAALGTGGKLVFHMGTGNGTPAENNRTTSLAALPASWTTGPTWTGGTPSFYASSAVTAPPDPPDQVGQWGDVMDWPIVAAHAVLMTSGKTLEIDGWTAPSPSIVYDQNLGGVSGGGFTRIDNPLGLDVFCAGNVTLPDGRILLAGGHGFTATLGLQETTIYDPSNDTWVAGPKMQYARWYPTETELGDGRIVTISGNITNTSWADTPEIYDPVTNRWSTMTGINTSGVHEEEYPLTYLLPNGKIITIATSAGRTYMMDPQTPSWTQVPGSTSTRNASGIMYRPGKILLTGGGTPLNTNNPAQTGAETMDTTVANPTWTPAQPMLKARYAHTLTNTPDGKVLAIGGGGDMNQEDLASGELSAEEWDPDTGAWTKLQSMPVPRLYHSTSMLMPDGRILVTGGGHANGPQSPSEYNAEFYSPPYLFRGARPSITSVPASTSYGTSIEVGTPDADSIRSVSLVNLAADTHTLDMNQHFVPLTFTKHAGGLSVDMPASPNLAPPNTYMLFIVNDRGVPSIAPFMKLLPSTVAPTVRVTTPASGATVNGTVPLTATASDTTGITSLQFTVDGTAVGPRLTSAPYTYNWDSTTLANGTHTIGAVAVNGVGTRGTATGVSVTTNNVGLMSPTLDGSVSTEGNGTINAPALTTTGSSDVVLAFVTTDGPATGQTATVSGAGLTWSLVKRVNARGGSTEIWKAKATAVLNRAVVTSTQGRGGFNQSVTVAAFSGASAVGASATANAATGAPTVSLTPTKVGSLVWGAGNDYDRAVAHTPSSGQAIVHQWLDTAIGDSYWVQNRTAPTSSLGNVAISDSAPTGDAYNLAAVEVLP